MSNPIEAVLQSAQFGVPDTSPVEENDFIDLAAGRSHDFVQAMQRVFGAEGETQSSSSKPVSNDVAGPRQRPHYRKVL